MTTFRPYGTGFFYGNPASEGQIDDGTTYKSKAVYLGSIETAEAQGNDTVVTFMQKNKFSVGEEIEIMKPGGRILPAEVLSIQNGEGMEVLSAPHPLEQLSVKLSAEADPFDLIRRKEPCS